MMINIENNIQTKINLLMLPNMDIVNINTIFLAFIALLALLVLIITYVKVIHEEKQIIISKFSFTPQQLETAKFQSYNMHSEWSREKKDTYYKLVLQSIWQRDSANWNSRMSTSVYSTSFPPEAQLNSQNVGELHLNLGRSMFNRKYRLVTVEEPRPISSYFSVVLQPTLFPSRMYNTSTRRLVLSNRDLLNDFSAL